MTFSLKEAGERLEWAMYDDIDTDTDIKHGAWFQTGKKCNGPSSAKWNKPETSQVGFVMVETFIENMH